MRTTWPILMSVGLLLGSCAVEEPAPTGMVEVLPPRQQLIRLSMDLRGVHPTETELVAFEENPYLYTYFVDQWIEDPRFLDRMTEIFNHRYLTRTGESYFNPAEAGLSQVPRAVVADVVAEEPLQLLRYVLQNDLPYSTMVTAEHTMANPILARMWDIERQEGDGWQPGTYRDGRPHSGVLSMTTIWQRYPSMGGNANRHRANAISQLLLCDDYLARPIVLNRAAVDQLTVDPENAIATNPTCQSCHTTLDPLAANLFGFFNEEDMDGIEQTVYRPENEQAWRRFANKPPGYFGRPVAHLVELGREIAVDPRFAECAVKTVFEGLTQRTVTDADWAELQAHVQVFEATNQRIPEVVRSIVTSENYLAKRAYEPEDDSRIAGLKVASPAQLASMFEDLTGYRWTFRGRDGLTTQDLGLPVLTGGVDGIRVTRPNYIPSVGHAFALERLAQSAAWHVARQDLDPERTDEARLLKYVTIEDTPESSPDAFEAQVRHLYLALTGLPLPDDAPEPDELIAVWKYLHSVEASPIAAWAGVTSAVLRDPLLVFY